MRFWRTLILTAALPPLSWGAGERILLRSGFPFIDVEVNGQGPFRMLIDTGAASCMLTPQAAAKAGLKYDHRVTLASMAGEKVIPAASGNAVKAGSVERAPIEIDVVGLEELRGLDARADGVLGQNFFTGAPYLIDYRNKRLWVGGDAAARSADLPIAVEASELHGRVVLPVKLDESARPWRLTLDSGASDLVVTCNDRCPPLSAVQRGDEIVTYSGGRPVSRGRLERAEVGGMKIPAPEAILVESSASDGQDDGVLPARWFSAIYVDGPSVRLARK